MSAAVKLESSSRGQLPLFYPGQVLSDDALSGIAAFARSGLVAESQRHGWGIVYGLFLSAESGSSSVTISRGMVADQDGGLFVLDQHKTAKLTDLLSKTDQQTAAASGEAIPFDLWLSIGVEQVAGALPFRNIGVAVGFAPVVEKPATAPAISRDKRPSREKLIACVALRAESKLQQCADDESGIVRKFEADFNKEAMNWDSETPYRKKVDKIHACRAEILAKLYDSDRVRYDGIPLGRVFVRKSENGDLVVDNVDCGAARREQAPPLLPSKADHINSAALFGLKRDRAVSWLARNGFPRWSIEPMTEKSARQKMSDDQEFLCWDVELRAGTVAKLYTDEGSIALVKQGPTIEEEFDGLLGQIISLKNELMRLWGALALLLVMFLIVGALVFIYYH